MPKVTKQERACNEGNKDKNLELHTTVHTQKQ